jgi:hypothetical protein
VLHPKDAIEYFTESVRPTLERWAQLFPIQQPDCDLQLRVLGQQALNALEELPHDSSEHCASCELTGRRVDEVGKGIEKRTWHFCHLK